MSESEEGRLHLDEEMGQKAVEFVYSHEEYENPAGDMLLPNGDANWRAISLVGLRLLHGIYDALFDIARAQEDSE